MTDSIASSWRINAGRNPACFCERLAIPSNLAQRFDVSRGLGEYDEDATLAQGAQSILSFLDVVAGGFPPSAVAKALRPSRASSNPPAKHIGRSDTHGSIDSTHGSIACLYCYNIFPSSEFHCVVLASSVGRSCTSATPELEVDLGVKARGSSQT